MASIVRRLEDEFDMEVEFISSSSSEEETRRALQLWENRANPFPTPNSFSSSSAIIYPEDAEYLGYSAEEIRSRLMLQFFEEEENPLLEDGQIYESEKPPLDVVIISHILSKSESGHFDCPICYEESIPQAKRVTISCGHNFCMTCTVDLLKMCEQDEKNVTCPMCRHPCFLLETPDEPQFKEIGMLLDEFAELRDIREQDIREQEDSWEQQDSREQQEYEAFRQYHYYA